MVPENNRRNRARPDPAKPAFNLKLDRLVSPIINQVHPPLRGTSLLWILIACCALWTYWCIESRMAPLRGYGIGVSEEVHLQEQVDALRQSLAQVDEAELVTLISTAEQQILPGYESLAGWLTEQAAAANEAGLEFSYVISRDGITNEDPALIKVPVDLTLKINVHSPANDSYRRLIQQAMVIHSSPWTKEMTTAKMEAVGGKAETLELRVAVWMQRSDDRFNGLPSEIELITNEAAQLL